MTQDGSNSLTMPKKVTVRECICRDGFQHEEHFIPTEAKIWLANQMTKAGFKGVDVTNLMPAKYNPQFRDADEVLKGIERAPNVAYMAAAIGWNSVKKAVAGAEAGHGPTDIHGGVCTSEYYSQHNLGRTSEEILKIMPEWIKMCHDVGIKYGGAVMTVFGYPVEGRISIEKALELAEKVVELEPDWLVYGDSTGEGSPERAYELFSRSISMFPHMTHVAHFHDSRGWGISNCLAALEAGVDVFDTSIGGLGGMVANMLDGVPIPGVGKYTTPSDITGNVCTEDLVVMLDEMGIETGLDVDMVLDIGRTAERIVGRRLKSNCVRSGRPLRREEE